MRYSSDYSPCQNDMLCRFCFTDATLSLILPEPPDEGNCPLYILLPKMPSCGKTMANSKQWRLSAKLFSTSPTLLIFPQLLFHLSSVQSGFQNVLKSNDRDPGGGLNRQRSFGVRKCTRIEGFAWTTPTSPKDACCSLFLSRPSPSS